MFYQIFLSPQVKRCAIITYKYGIYELPHELPNDKKTQDLKKLENIRKLSKRHRMIPQRPVPPPKWKFCQYQKKTLEKQKLNFSVVHYLTWKLELACEPLQCPALYQKSVIKNSNTSVSTLAREGKFSHPGRRKIIFFILAICIHEVLIRPFFTSIYQFVTKVSS